MKKFLLFAAAACVAMSASADFFVVGSNINGVSSWWDGGDDPEFKVPGHMKDMGNGIWKWEGTELGTGFKLNNGTWDAPTNFGGNGAEIEEGEEYELGIGSNANIMLWNCAVVKKPVVTLNVSNPDAPTVIVEGEWGGTIDWYLTGMTVAGERDWNVLDNEAANCFKAVDDEEGIFVIDAYTIEDEEGSFKVSSTGYGAEYGTTDGEITFIDAENMSAELEPWAGQGGDVPYTLTPGDYKITWNLNDKAIVFEGADTAVEGIAAEEVEYTYYNMQGVKVANPVNGVFVKVAGKKALKVVK